MGNSAQQLHVRMHKKPLCNHAAARITTRIIGVDHILPLLQFSPAIDLSQRLAELTKMLEIHYLCLHLFFVQSYR